MELFKWLNDQLLRMDWLAWLVHALLEDGFGLDMSGRVGASLHFFIYDVIKIFILLSVLIFSISWVQSYFPPERTRRILGGMRGLKARRMKTRKCGKPEDWKAEIARRVKRAWAAQATKVAIIAPA